MHSRQPLRKDLLRALARANLIIFESNASIMLMPRLRKLNPKARFVYRVSDDLRTLRANPAVLRAEKRYARLFDLVSVTNQDLYLERFAHLENSRLHYHGVPKHLFDETVENPYPMGSVNLIYVGNVHCDVDFFHRASRLFPDLTFHVIGPVFGLPIRKNIVSYGEIPFLETLPYVKFGDVGLNPRSSGTFGDGNKVWQYTYCRLPIVTSSMNRSQRPHVFYYDVGDDNTIRQAILQTLRFDRARVPAGEVQSWDDLTNALLESPPP